MVDREADRSYRSRMNGQKPVPTSARFAGESDRFPPCLRSARLAFFSRIQTLRFPRLLGIDLWTALSWECESRDWFARVRHFHAVTLQEKSGSVPGAGGVQRRPMKYVSLFLRRGSHALLPVAAVPGKAAPK